MYMLEANPGVDVYLPRSGSTLTIPQQLILPDTVREGIVINVAEMRLYYYPPQGNSVEVLPIGIGQAGRETPRNWVTAVERKQEGPTWVPTANTRREYAKEGKTLPAMVPPGPDNPMGLYAIYIGRLYAIHGTNANFGIGLRVSQGCIRLLAGWDAGSADRSAGEVQRGAGRQSLAGGARAAVAQPRGV